MHQMAKKLSSVQFSRSVMSESLQPHGPQHTSPPCPPSTPGVYSNSCPLSWWYHPTISSSGVPFSSRLPSFPTSGSFQMSQFFTSGGQSIGVSTSASVLPVNIQDLLHVGWIGWISLLSKGFSIVFSNTTVQKHQFFTILYCKVKIIIIIKEKKRLEEQIHQFFGTKFSLWSNSHIHTWLLEET